MTIPATNKAHKAKKKDPIKMIYAGEFTLAEGFSMIEDVFANMQGEAKWFVNGERVKRDFDRFNVLKNVELKCFRCGAQATHFVVEKHRNDRVMPFSLNVYSGRKMLTWDHILPKSYDGSDHVINSRCACSSCNENRGNDMTLKEMVWVANQDPTLIYKIQQTGKAKLKEIIGMVKKEFQLMELPEEVSLQ